MKGAATRLPNALQDAQNSAPSSPPTHAALAPTAPSSRITPSDARASSNATPTRLATDAHPTPPARRAERAGSHPRLSRRRRGRAGERGALRLTETGRTPRRSDAGTAFKSPCRQGFAPKTSGLPAVIRAHLQPAPEDGREERPAPRSRTPCARPAPPVCWMCARIVVAKGSPSPPRVQNPSGSKGPFRFADQP